MNYTVTHLNQGGEVDIAFRVQSISNSVVAVWQEDNTPRNETTGTFTAGTPFKVTAPNVQPVGPVAQDDSFSVTSEHPATLAVLANDVDYTAALDPTTVTILGQPNHGGSAVANPVTGEVAYTSAVGFIA